jgi:pimeloyl-ACP methyl ester carboxylesterase
LKSFAGKKFNICYRAWGNPKNRAVVFFHGFPGCHKQATFMVPILEKNNIFLLAADRPGYGGTTGQGTAAEFITDLHDLSVSLGVERIDVLGVSGGSPYAHLMASQYAEKVRSLGVICGLGPLNQDTIRLFSLGQISGLLARRFLPSALSQVIIDFGLKFFEPEKSMHKFLDGLHEVDRDALLRPENWQLILESMKNSRKQGGKGIHFDTGFYQRDWLRKDCDIERLSKIPTFYFHGHKDQLLRHELSEWMHKNNPNSKLKYFDFEGHYSLPLTQAVLIFETLVQF